MLTEAVITSAAGGAAGIAIGALVLAAVCRTYERGRCALSPAGYRNNRHMLAVEYTRCGDPVGDPQQRGRWGDEYADQ